MDEFNFQDNIKVIIKKFKDNNFDFVIKRTNFILKDENNYDLLWTLRGISYLNKNDKINSLKCLKVAVRINPKNIDAKNYLGNLYKSLNKLKEAEKCYNECININSNYISSLFNLANLKIMLNNFNEAILLYNRALKVTENIEKIHINLAHAYQSTKQFKKAELILKKCLKKFPLSTEADRLLSSQINFINDEDHLESMIKKLENKKINLNRNQKIDLLFSIGKGFEDKKDYKKSFHYYSKGNYLKRKTLKSNIDQKIILFDKVRSFFSNFEYKNNIFNKEKKIIFIFGLPRSGTTLIESIISSHDKVSSVGEINFLSNFINSNFFKDNKFVSKDISNFLRIGLKKEYFDYLSLFNLKNDIITDKSLNNYFYLGFIKHFFPGSKLIHCQRNIEDNFLSIYKNLFTDNEAWKYDKEEMVKYYNLYKKIISFWNKKMSKDILNVNYEDLINNKDYTIKKIISHCGLNWSEKCLNHQKYNIPIRTLSVNQASKPIYSSSIGSSKNYKIYLKEMFHNLKLQSI